MTNVSLPKATFVKLEPQSCSFLEISNPRAVLEHSLRKFSCVTKGDVIRIPYNDKSYELKLLDVKPTDAACIIETDCNVDFAPPVGYEEPDYKEIEKEKNRAVYGGMMVNTKEGGVRKRSESDGLPASGDELPCAPSGTRIISGNVIPSPSPSPSSSWSSSASSRRVSSSMVAPRRGSTGAQANAAIKEPDVGEGYWTGKGGGDRLDGKKASPVKVAGGVGVPGTGGAVDGGFGGVEGSVKNDAGGGNEGRRVSRIGTKYGKRKSYGIAFEGKGNKLV